MSNLRKLLGDGRLVTQGRGYRLQIEPGQTDVDRFEALVARGRPALGQGDALTAAAVLREALEVWRGPALAEFAFEPFAQPETARLEESRLVVLEDRIDADLALGEHTRLVGELEALVREHPLRERLQGQLMLALYRSGRRADALETYHIARDRLIDELGLEPGRALRELERAILAQDPALDAPGRPAARRSPATARRSLRGAALIAAGGAVLLAAIVAVAVKLAGSGARRGDGGAQFAGRDRPSERSRGGGGRLRDSTRCGRVRAGSAVDRQPRRAAAWGNSVWVAPSTGLLTRFSAVTGDVTEQLDPNAGPAGIAITGDGAVWLTDSQADEVVRVSDVRVRQAVNYAINRQALAAVGRGFQALPDTPTDHYLPPGMPGYRAAHVYPLTPDLAKARQLIAATHAARRTAVIPTVRRFPPLGCFGDRGGYSLLMTFTRITVRAEQMDGVPCIRGLRIPVATVVGMIAEGMTANEVLDAYPDLELADVQEALHYAAEAVRERELPLAG